MPASAVPPTSLTDGPPPTLAARSFPRRVRRLLEGILEYASDELERGLTSTLNDAEQQLFKLAEQSRNNDLQARYLEALRAIKRGRSDLVPRYMIGLEAALASIKEPGGPLSTGAPRRRFGELSLVDDIEMDESAVLSEVAGRAEIRNSLALYLLCQRFGVLAGRPAFDAETLPVGPHLLCRIMRSACDCLELGSEYRLVVFRQFERQVMPTYGSFVEALNTYLARQGVLPHLQFVPIRVKPPTRRSASEDDDKSTARGGEASARPAPGRHASGAGAASAPQPHTAWPGESVYGGGEEDPQQANEMFGILRQLLAGRRQLIGKLNSGGPSARGATFVASSDDVESVLGVLQQRPATSVLVDGKPMPRSVTHVKQDLLAQLRQITPGNKAPALSDEDGDAIDLVGMLFDHIMKDVRPNSPAASLLAKLQVPLLRVALRDKGFFTRQQHPARQMLNAIAETGAYWLGEDEADRGLIEKMQMLVDRAVSDFDGDTTLFDVLLGDLTGTLQTVVRKAEVAEKRHVEAARGKEKLALARMRAGEAVGGMLGSKRLPRFIHTLLSQAWTDVLALTALRHGEDSDAWRQQIGVAERLVAAAAAKPGTSEAMTPEEAKPLRTQIGDALAQVGYHAEEAAAIAQRLTADPAEAGEDDPASRTELAMKLKTRTRLGEDIDTKHDEKTPPLSTEEQAWLDQIKQLPFGSWFEFVTNQQGDRIRRRLSWFSTVTGHALFVNHRGQRTGEHTLDWLARAMAKGQVRLVQAERGSLIDRAWGAVVTALRSFAGRVPTDEGGKA